MLKFQNVLIYDNFIGIKSISSLIKEAIPYTKIHAFSNKAQIDFAGLDYDNDFLNFIYINSFDSYSMQLIESNIITSNIVIISDIPINIFFNRLSRFNIIGYIDRDSIFDNTFKELFIKILDNKIYMSEDDKDLLLEMHFDKQSNNSITNPLSLLSLQEYNVMKNLLVGKSINEIAVELNLHKSSISTYKKRILKKLSVKNIYELNIILNS
ncbi:MAG: LuxR C-terminal-related transcriptional regulator [Chitinophagia bacterium]